jgi:hypothetical protein
MDIKVVKSAIMMNGYSNTQLNELAEAIRYARGQLGREIKQSIRVGDNVNFVDNRSGTNHTGAVTKIAIKYVTVSTVKGLYRVPASMLTVV